MGILSGAPRRFSNFILEAEIWAYLWGFEGSIYAKIAYLPQWLSGGPQFLGRPLVGLMGLVKDHSYRSLIKSAVANGGHQKICNFSKQVVVEDGSEVKVVLVWDRLSWILFIHLPVF